MELPNRYWCSLLIAGLRGFRLTIEEEIIKQPAHSRPHHPPAKMRADQLERDDVVPGLVDVRIFLGSAEGSGRVGLAIVSEVG